MERIVTNNAKDSVQEPIIHVAKLMDIVMKVVRQAIGTILVQLVVE